MILYQSWRTVATTILMGIPGKVASSPTSHHTGRNHFHGLFSHRHSFILERGLVLSIRPVMSAYTYKTDTRHQPYPQSTPLDDVKASFDDLVDPYSSPFAPNSRHQTFVVGTPLKQQPPLHQREPSVPLSTKADSLKKSEDTNEIPYNYPPTLSQKEVVETQSLWKQVCVVFSIIGINQHHCNHPACSGIDTLSTLSRDCPYGNCHRSRH